MILFSTKARITICFSNRNFFFFYLNSQVIQYKLNHPRNNNFKEQLRLIFVT